MPLAHPRAVCSSCGTTITTVTQGGATTTEVVHYDGTTLTTTTIAAGMPEPEQPAGSTTAHGNRVLAMQASAIGAVPAASASDTITVGGFASLMDEASARATTPSISNWRYGYVDGFCRVFNLVSILNVKKGAILPTVTQIDAYSRANSSLFLSHCSVQCVAGLATGDYLATCTVRPKAGAKLRVRFSIYFQPKLRFAMIQ